MKGELKDLMVFDKWPTPVDGVSTTNSKKMDNFWENIQQSLVHSLLFP